jgi:flavorubredoxin
MKISIIYHTKFGNNEKVADFLADQFKIEDVSVYSTRKHNPKHIIHSDLYIISTPTHMGNAPFKIRRFLKKIKYPEKFRYAVINTYGATTKAVDTISTILENFHGQNKGSLNIKISGMSGPLEENWQEKIKIFAQNILS